LRREAGLLVCFIGQISKKFRESLNSFSDPAESRRARPVTEPLCEIFKKIFLRGCPQVLAVAAVWAGLSGGGGRALDWQRIGECRAQPEKKEESPVARRAGIKDIAYAAVIGGRSDALGAVPAVGGWYGMPAA